MMIFVKAQPSGQGTAISLKKRKVNDDHFGFLHPSTPNNLLGDVDRWVLKILNNKHSLNKSFIIQQHHHH